MRNKIYHIFIALLGLVACGQSSVFVQFNSDAAFSAALVTFSARGVTFHSNNSTMEIYAVPLRFKSNPTRWEPISALLIDETVDLSQFSNLSLAFVHSVLPTPQFFSYESWAARTVVELKPTVLLAFGGAFAAGGYQVNRLSDNSRIDTISVPVVHMTQGSADVLFELFTANGRRLNLTITDSPTNPFFDRRSGTTFIVYSVILAGWAFGIIVLSCVTMYRRSPGRNLGTLCLIMDILGAIVRFVFALDPYADRFIPSPILDTLFTVSFPIVLSGTILLGMFWHELATVASLTVSPVLERNTAPAIASVVVMFIAEIASDSFRAVKFHGDIVQTVSVILYLIFALLIAIFFIYVFVIVLRFLSTHGLGGRKLSVLRTFSIRAVCCVVGLLTIIIVTICYSAGLNNTEFGEGILNFFGHAAIGMISTAQVLALFSSSRSEKTSKARSSSAKSESVLQSQNSNVA